MSGRKIVVLGMMAKMPVPGVVWQTLHYLVGLRDLGFDAYYVEAHARTPTMLMQRETDDGSARAAAFLDASLRPYGFAHRWAFHALHDDGRVFGLSAAELAGVLRDAELLINLHGGTEPREELTATNRLVYLETDPVQLQIELHDGLPSAREFLGAHCAIFTFAENLAGADCTLPRTAGYDFRPTRQPVVLDLWDARDRAPGTAFRTIGNFHQGWRSVTFNGETYGWSKDAEWRKFLRLAQRTGQEFELALSGYAPRHEEELTRLGFRVRPALDFNFDNDGYREFILGSRGEFTVAKDQNIRFRTGWFSDRSATFLAAGRPVVTQDTAFGAVLPTGAGLHAVSDLDEAVAAIEQIAADPSAAGRAAAEIAREHFDAERVLGRLLTDMGVALNPREAMNVTAGPERIPDSPAALPRPAHLHRDSSVLALIPHFECEQYLDDCLAALCAQTRPLDGIVVIDDASAEAPLDIVRRHPGVTLLRAEENSGPYRLVQQVIDDTDYDAYLFQDADDWSAPDRLEKLLEHAEATGADMIGSQEVRVFCDEPEVVTIDWPLDGNEPFRERPTAFPLLHPTTLVSRRAMVAAGGYSKGLRFGGDAEFLRRVHYVARCVNTPHPGYFRRIRQGSLTTAPGTAIGTPARRQLMEETFARATANAERAARGEAPDLSPLRPGPAIRLERLCGPQLQTPGRGPRRARPAVSEAANHDTAAAAPDPPTPVFVVGADRSGASALAAALGQHPSIALSLHGGWLGPLAGALHGLRDAALEQDPATFGVRPPAAEEISAAFGPAAGELAGGGAARFWVDGSWQLARDVPALAAMFPQAKFIHVVRDVHSAVRALADPPLGAPGATGGTQIPARLREKLSERDAVERWTETASACLAARRGLGAERMLTVSFADLVADPEATTRRCLEFVGESYAPECMRPLRELRTLVDAAPLQPDVDPELWERALEVDREARSVATVRSLRARGRDGRSPRIVMVTDHFPKFSETFFVRKFLGLLRRGWDVHIVCQRSSDEQWAYFPELRAQIRHEGRLHVARENLDQRVVDLRPDIVHFGYGTLAHGRTHIRAAAGCRTVTSFRGYDLNSFRLEDPGCFDEVFATTDVVHAVSGAIWRRAQERGCPPERPHEVITDAVDVAWFDPPAQRDGGVLGTPQRPLRVLTVGRLHWKKGHDHALHATRLLVERGVEVEHRFVGEGEYREPTEFAIADLGLAGRAELLGARGAEEVRDLLAWADVLLHPSLTEAFGVAVIEAQAMALPVVCSDAGGLPENVEHGVTGFVVARRDATAMADRLAELAGDPALRRRMGAAARRRAETVLGDEQQLDRFEALYERLLEQAAAEGDVPAAGGDLGAARDESIAQLERELEQLAARQEALRTTLWRRQVADAVRAFAGRALPRAARVLVVSRGDEEIVELPGRRGAHFPQAPDGGYAGHHPADSEDAVAQLEALRRQGAEYLVVPSTSGWWLEHYGAFAAYLEREHARLPESGEHFVAYALAGPVLAPDRLAPERDAAAGDRPAEAVRA